MKLPGEVAVVTDGGRGSARRSRLCRRPKPRRSRTAAEIDAAGEEIAAQGGIARANPLDIVDLGAVERTFAAVERDPRQVSLLINNAGRFTAFGPIWTAYPETWWRDVESNIRGTFNCCRVALPGMVARKRGRIINVIGGGGAASFPNGSGYATSKAGLLRFTECVSDTLEGTGVLIFAMDPGLVRTAMTELQLQSEAGRKYLTDIPRLFERGVDVPPTLAARLSVEISAGRFDRLAGRMLMAARGDLDLDEATVDQIVGADLRSLRVSGMPQERPSAR